MSAKYLFYISRILCFELSQSLFVIALVTHNALCYSLENDFIAAQNKNKSIQLKFKTHI